MNKARENGRWEKTEGVKEIREREKDKPEQRGRKIKMQNEKKQQQILFQKNFCCKTFSFQKSC